ncbi:MAG: 3-ketoacyl-ACP reductase [Thermoguttaceae bacterium]|nr:3-ketoacyl-ACP reductase [Thermoguttaceae bacterium]
MAKTALVTGGGRGIGAGIVDALAAEGWNVVFCGRTDPEKYASRVREIEEKYGVGALYVHADIADEATPELLLEKTLERFGALNALVNNSGVAPLVRADILEASRESFDRVMGINLRGPYFLTQRVARYMIEQKKLAGGFSAAVVTIGSISATVASVSRGEYCLSKAGVAMMCRLFAVRLAEFGIPVYELRPGIVHSDMTSTVREKYDKLIAEGLTLQPRWGEPTDVGRAVAMLLRGDLAYSTGQVINIDGGMEIGRL